uniref:Uncharacterized protein n=2 Tax=Lotharella globosa TaxID=91324 RepID=A0A6U3AQ47_9EUKA|mmetsp:Transcript_2429/g.4631  ORF Transcript_2429/g.4631 Transcript_2429/m.4631 type:complete len:324 (+) Transcript_2429:17-988(+)
MEDMRGKVVVVTGATGSIGKEIAFGLAARGAEVVLAARNIPKAQNVAKEIIKRTKNKNIRIEQVDLSSPVSISSFASRLSSSPPEGAKIDVLVNNAAVITSKKTLTPDGLELQFATNVLSYFLLSTLLRPLLRNAAQSSKDSKKGSFSPSRIVNVASYAAGGLDINDLNYEKRRYDSNGAYMASKQANRMISRAAAERFKDDGIIVHSCHPGVTTSNILREFGMAQGFESADAAAATPIFLASYEPASQLGTGKFWKDCREAGCEFVRNKKAVDTLWDKCKAYCTKILGDAASSGAAPKRKLDTEEKKASSAEETKGTDGSSA